jgi:hypothetical protein
MTMTEQEINTFAQHITNLRAFLLGWGTVAPDLREALQPVLNEMAKAQTEARVEAMLYARSRGLSDEDSAMLANQVTFMPL